MNETESKETKDTTYQGWTNYETWNVMLWIGNEQGFRESLLEMVEGQSDYEACSTISDYFKYELNPLVDTASMYSDILSAALSDVNWLEVVEHLREEE